MGWLERWREARAEAAVRRQLAAHGGEASNIDSIDVVPVPDDGLPPVDVNDRSTWPTDFDDGSALWRPPRMAELAGDYGHEIAADGRRMPLHTAPDVPPPTKATVDTGPAAGMDVALAVNLPDLLAECARADALAGSHGGFVTTARIREILRGAA